MTESKFKYIMTDRQLLFEFFHQTQKFNMFSKLQILQEITFTGYFDELGMNQCDDNNIGIDLNILFTKDQKPTNLFNEFLDYFNLNYELDVKTYTYDPSVWTFRLVSNV